ncbi:MAG: heavy metal translocating P-type ATPase [Geminicoccaceae bacterium]
MPALAHRLALGLAVAGLVAGGVAWLLGAPVLADRLWAAAILPALAVLLVGIVDNLRRGETGVDIVAALSMGGALALGEYLAGAVVAVMFAGGNVLEEVAGRRAERELTALLGRAPRVAHRERDGRLEDVPVDAVRPGDDIVVKSGEVLPVDGIVTGEPASLDESAMTGEALPVRREPGERARSGTVNAGAPLRLRATTAAADSTYAAIVRLVETARGQKAPMGRLADRWALFFLPLTLVMAGGAWALSGDPARALAVLVVATPCPLILAVPVAIVAGISAAARRGILVKGGAALETFARAATLMLDKTGTLTTGIARLEAIECPGPLDPDELVRLAASLDQVSQHPMAQAVVAAARGRKLPLAMPEQVVETPGAGLEGLVGGRRVRLGSLGYVSEGRDGAAWAERLARRAARDGSSGVFVAIDGELAGALLLADEIRIETPRALRALHRAGIRRIVMLSGDRLDVAETIAAAVGVDAVLAERSPQDKVDAVRAESAEAVTVMVGDGVNDAPALAAADVGVAMGARGAGAASEAADVVLMVDRIDRLAEGIATARRTRRIALESIVAGMGLSLLGMLAAAFGYLPPVAGALVQEAIDVAVILNALRALRGATPPQPVLEGASAHALEAEHKALLPLLDRLRALADRLHRGDGPEAVAELRAVEQELRTTVLPHERSDEAELHPRIATLLGGRDPMAAISRTHREIGHLARRLGRLVAELPAEGPSPEDLPELRRTLYALDAILRLHFAQEDEIYQSVAAEPARAARTAT